MNGSKFLIVAESDDTQAGFLCEQLAADGYPLDRARTVEHARALCAMRDPAVLIAGALGEAHATLGLVRGIRHGSAVTNRIAPDLATIVLLPERSQLMLLRAFEAGADDVLSKPVSYLELRARLGALVRRCWPPPRGQVRVGALALDPAAGLASCHGEALALTRLELGLLGRLAVDPERVVTKDELLREVWGYASPGRTRSVDAIACRLRRKLARAGADELVNNRRGVGYRLLPFPDGPREAA